jgi:hypothetical protein
VHHRLIASWVTETILIGTALLRKIYQLWAATQAYKPKEGRWRLRAVRQGKIKKGREDPLIIWLRDRDLNPL